MKRDWFMLFGMGYGLWGSAERMDRVFGHGGAGGSEGLVDRDNKLIVGYTCNYGKNSTVLRDKLYEVVGMRWRYWSDNVNIQDLQMNTVNGGDYVRGITSR
jgi:CubicO group peptidase (beta-lactamase class C family)